ncbi:interleukin 21 receptor, tandem duplicate 1 isoform X2 [Dunckerocampus dactyliophorus]|uniref:interleukin 21 receptor, tandem duplicate 1 isoform X2 n=1 Tax=Dunckerocampus dactyliophorus TaxID=161453 RepID=UPI0024065914|nr:interleukin 21 receptor, tandem duplicate 1 isoform X2 [Dunckerocampus dactyliophorus]
MRVQTKEADKDRLVVMAAVFLTLWGLTLLIQAAASSCGVTCYTDYDVLLNCSCASVPSQPLRLQVNCSSPADSPFRCCSDGELHAMDNCQVTPRRPWCVMYPDALYDVAAIGTECTACVSHQGGPADVITPSESSSWALSDVVKPLPPSDVRVTSAGGSYNITWDNNNKRHRLTYRLRIRAHQGLSQHPELSFSVDEKFLLLDCKKLPHRFSVELQAKMSPGSPCQGPWSEWSSTAEWTSTPADSPDIAEKRSWLYILLAVVLVVAALLLGFSQKPLLLKKLHLSTYVSKPHDFFKPLYLNYGGNFKEWVKPVFSEYDFSSNNAHVDIMTKKRLHCDNSHQSSDEAEPAGCLLHHIPVPDCSPLLKSQDGGSAQGTGLSAGHVSIHTVTLSGEEDFDKEASWSSLRSDRESPSYRELVSCDSDEPDMFQMERHSGILQEDSQTFNTSNTCLREPERASLASNEQSEDGYPCVDLDTVDSGYGECGSPSDSNSGEHRDFLHAHQPSRSNYVKQWMTYSTAGEDSANHLH